MIDIFGFIIFSRTSVVSLSVSHPIDSRIMNRSKYTISFNGMRKGFIYAFVNKYMPGIVKIGNTERSAVERLREANAPTWIPKDSYNILAVKEVCDPKRMEQIVHNQLKEFRIDSRREFFEIDPEKVIDVFDKLDDDILAEIVDEAEKEDSTPQSNAAKVKGCRDMRKAFADGQRIRHRIRKTNSTRIGTYDSSRNGIVYDGNTYSLNQFASSHHIIETPDRNPGVNEWKDCECEVDGVWVSTYSLSPL